MLPPVIVRNESRFDYRMDFFRRVAAFWLSTGWTTDQRLLARSGGETTASLLGWSFTTHSLDLASFTEHPSELFIAIEDFIVVYDIYRINVLDQDSS